MKSGSLNTTLTSLLRYLINGAVFLCVYLGAHIFGPSLWHYAAANVQHWWHRGASGDITSGLVGMAAFLVFGEYRRRERSARNVPAAARRQPSRSPSGPWA